MKFIHVTLITFALSGTPFASAEDAPAAATAATTDITFEDAASAVQRQLQESLDELTRLRDQIASEKIPLSRALADLERELVDARLEYQQTSRLLDSRTLDLSNLRAEMKSRQEETAYISNLLGEYIRNLESRLHIAELQRYREPLEQARLAPENSNLSQQEVFAAQAALLDRSLQRLQDALGGDRFDGAAVDSNGLVRPGTFVLVGPAGLFRSTDGKHVGTVEQRLGSLEPSVVAFETPAHAEAASQLALTSTGVFPLDPTLGNAHKIEQTEETFVEHVRKGGPVMVPIFALAGAALLVALYKWVSLLLVRTPVRKTVGELLQAVARGDANAARQKVASIRGPGGQMLQAGVNHLGEPRELVEEVMYETVLSTRLKLQSMLPFIAICAAAAPLLGLLGTVTGIMNTFTLITVFGTGDVKTLSSGISEALITTEYGLIVAIPSLLIHAWLSRKSRRVVDEMERIAVTFINQVGKSPFRADSISAPAPRSSEPVHVEHTRPAERKPAEAAPTVEQVRDVLSHLLAPMVKESIQHHARSTHSSATDKESADDDREPALAGGGRTRDDR